MAVTDLKEFARVLPLLLQEDTQQLQFTYDRQADVLYVSVGNARDADDGVMNEDGVITRYDADGAVAGYTILNASKLTSANAN